MAKSVDRCNHFVQPAAFTCTRLLGEGLANTLLSEQLTGRVCGFTQAVRVEVQQAVRREALVVNAVVKGCVRQNAERQFVRGELDLQTI